MILLPGGRLKSKPQGQAIPRESIYREWKISGTYSTSPFLAHSRFRLSIILFSLDEPRSEPHLRTVPLARHDQLFSIGLAPWRLRAYV